MYGAHVNKAARIEPITLPGAIYVSEQFAATLKVETRDHYRYNHVGKIDLPKKFGKQELYSVTNKTSISLS